LIYGVNCELLGCLQISERDLCLAKLDTEFLIVCFCSREVHTKFKFGHVRKFPCLLQRDAECSPDSRKVGGIVTWKGNRKRTPVSTWMKLRSASGQRCC